MNAEDLKPGSIMVGIDGSDDADRALDWAADQAALESRPLAVVHVVDDRTLVVPMGAGIVPHPHDAAQTSGKALLLRAASRARSGHGELQVATYLRLGDPRHVLLDLAADAHLMVLGSRGRGPLRSLLLGSVSAAVSRHAACPVVVVRPSSAEEVRDGVLVGADGTPESRPVIEFAFRQASLRGLPLTVLHSFWDVAAAYAVDPHVPLDSPDARDHRRQLQESVAGIGEKFPDVPVTLALNRGSSHERLTRAHRRPWRLTVVGHHHRRGLTRLVTTSTAIAVLERANGTVAIVPEAAPGSVDPGAR